MKVRWVQQAAKSKTKKREMLAFVWCDGRLMGGDGVDGREDTSDFIGAFLPYALIVEFADLAFLTC